MRIYYASLTGNVRRFVSKLDADSTDILSAPKADKPYVLITYTFGFGDVPNEVKRWLADNHSLLRGVAVSGNRNWGERFGAAGNRIAKQFGVPLLHKFELAGTDEDVRIFKERLAVLCDTTN